MKILGLDVGDKWVGVALSDGLGISCKPFETISHDKLSTYLRRIIPQENITTVVIGNPITMQGKESAQTKKVILLKEALASELSQVNGQTILWELWDERLSSKRAQALQKKGDYSKEAKRKEHAIAAAFILQGYLDNKAFQSSF